MFQVKELAPFEGNIERRSFGKHRNPIGVLADDPLKVVRHLHLFNYDDPDYRNRRYQEVINAWTEFGGYPGIKIPQFTPYSNFFVVADLIEGETLKEKDFSADPQAPPIVGRFLGSLVDYASDKYHNGGVYISDQKAEQYMYGVAPGESDPRVFFVDLDYERGVFDAKNPYDLDQALFLSGISTVFRVVERKFTPGVFFNERLKLLQLLEEDLRKNRSYFVKNALEKFRMPINQVPIPKGS